MIFAAGKENKGTKRQLQVFKQNYFGMRAQTTFVGAGIVYGEIAQSGRSKPQVRRALAGRRSRAH